MATTNNVVMANVPKGAGSHDIWPHVWAATRAAKKCGWKILASSDGTSKTVSDAPELDEWGAGATTGVSGTSHSIAAASGGRATVTGLSGIVAADKGRFLRVAGGATAANNHDHQIEEILSATSVRIDARRTAFTPGTDANDGTGGYTWEVFDPTTEAHPSGLDSVVAWILMEGPSTIKVPITSAPVAGTTFNFIRGENVSQATTSAEGEVLGWVFDPDASAGYLVILPRVIGSGGDPYGWDTTNVITGGTSGATVTQVGTALEYAQRCVLSKEANENSGHMYVQCVDPVNESSEDFLTLVSAAGCTATVQPGGGGTANAFPSIAFTTIGATGSVTGARWSASTAGNTHATNGQVIAVDAIWEEDHSADGTWAFYSARTTVGSSTAIRGAYQARGMYRLDDTEPGELDLFVCFGNSSVTSIYHSANRTTANETSNGSPWQANCTSEEHDGNTFILFFRGWQGRGSGSGTDQFTSLELVLLWGLKTNQAMVEVGTSGADNVVSAPVTTRAREPVRVASLDTANKIRKGSIRHLQIVGAQAGHPNTLYDSGSFIQLSDIPGAFIAGPWDGTSIPTST